MKQYLFPATISTLLLAVTALNTWNASTSVELLRLTDQLAYRVDVALSRSERAIESAEYVRGLAELNEQRLEGVPSLIVQSLESNQLLSDLSRMRGDRIRLRRIVNGEAAMPPAPEDVQDYDSLIQDIELACDRLANLGADHRECRR